jgi:F-type H+-transporting ATPase subunit gamma
MANLRKIRKRIRSVSSTGKMTKAMKMVAASRFRRGQEAVTQGRPYAEGLSGLLTEVLGGGSISRHPLFRKGRGKRRLLVVLTSDRGLCGGFNSNLLRSASIEMGSGGSTGLLAVGRKGAAFLARRYPRDLSIEKNFWKDLDWKKAGDFAARLAERCRSGEWGSVDILFSEFRSVISHKPVVLPLLPLRRAKPAGRRKGEPLREPDRDRIVEALAPRVVAARVWWACLNSLASEHGARMTAMDSATRNAQDMIADLTLKMNRARQAAITKDLVEIVSAVEALK